MCVYRSLSINISIIVILRSGHYDVDQHTSIFSCILRLVRIEVLTRCAIGHGQVGCRWLFHLLRNGGS